MSSRRVPISTCTDGRTTNLGASFSKAPIDTIVKANIEQVLPFRALALPLSH